MDEYIRRLFKQYEASVGSGLDFNNYHVKKEFYSWLKNLKEEIELYKIFLKHYEVDINKSDTVELDKGIIDTLTNFDSKTILITKYANSFENTDSRRIINGGLDLSHNVPIIKPIKSDTKIILFNPNIFISTNPYHDKQVNTLQNICYHNYNVLLGIYGNIYDKDYMKKRELLKKFNDRNQLEIQLARVGETYLGLSYTKRR